MLKRVRAAGWIVVRYDAQPPRHRGRAARSERVDQATKELPGAGATVAPMGASTRPMRRLGPQFQRAIDRRPTGRKVRACLGWCERTFVSTGPEDRFCQTCRKRKADLARGM